MERYQGITSGDAISSGGSYIADHGFGHEIFNFLPIRGHLYGYVQPPGKRDKWTDAQINLTRLGAKPDDESISGVTAVWVATLQGQGAFVLGWYNNATIFRSWQQPPLDSARIHEGADLGFYVTCDEKDAILIPPDERVFSVPQQVRGGFGQANIWYADDHELNRQFRIDLLRYIATRESTASSDILEQGYRQTDPLLRRRVEQAAIDLTISHYAQLHYRIRSVERDNVGWDLEASRDGRDLKLEVKGLCGGETRVELTPNEYQAMSQNAQTYRLCIVTNALDKPSLEIFSYSNEAGCWKGTSGRTLNVVESVAARCSVLE
ncbi:DUF3883 domain-containing protein [Paludisphaera soli]|uniref:DUF3883 domain-containing protein n=1 Tax=Paludisphaera soli TaxID=2712865 RepID=UPI0013EA6D40|nr:DUF3883 domain-containing protein [Paludisphaera soli]